MSSRNALNLLFLVGLLLTPTTPLAQSLPFCHDKDCSGGSSINRSRSSRTVPWWWGRLKSKRVSDDSEGEPMHHRMLSLSRRIGNLFEDVYQGAAVPVHCVTLHTEVARGVAWPLRDDYVA